MYNFYHVAYSKPYNQFNDFELNKIYTFGASLNSFYNYFYNTEDHVNIRVNGELQSVHFTTNLAALSNGECSSYPNPQVLLPYLNKKFENLFNLSRELLLENIRLTTYSHLPSRKTSLWVTKSRDEAEVWVEYFRKDALEGLKLIQFESVNDVSSKLDSKWLPLKSDSLSEQEKKAHKYWSGEESQAPMIEYLFQGEATVKSIEIL